MDFRLVERAYSDFAELLKKANECRTLFEQAHLPLPEPLQRLLGLNIETNGGHNIPAMRVPTQPENFEVSWIWVPANQCTVNSLVLAVLRGAAEPMPVPRVIEEVSRAKGEEVNAGSVANVGTRLDKDAILTRDDSGWKLARPDRAPVLHNKHLWASPAVLEKQEVAAHRRMAILHVLREFEGGLQVVQIVQMLKEKSPWLNRDIPCNKDLLKTDMEVLSEQGLVKKQGNSGKWVTV